jgi:hypothetical protein
VQNPAESVRITVVAIAEGRPRSPVMDDSSLRRLPEKPGIMGVSDREGYGATLCARNPW